MATARQNLSNPPGMDPTGGIISVASYYDQDTGTRDGTVSDFSSRGLAGDQSTYPDISAPGENITSSCRLYLAICSTGLAPENGPGPLDVGTFNTISGTSMAAPHIAGIVAQLFQANPAATPAQVEDALKTTAHKYADGAAYEPGPLGTTSLRQGLRPRRRGRGRRGGPLTPSARPTAAVSRGWRPSVHPQGCWPHPEPGGRFEGSPTRSGPTCEEV